MSLVASPPLPGFVSIQHHPLDQPGLAELVTRCLEGPVWCCLRWPDRTQFYEPTSAQPIQFSAGEGQVFNQARELRWQRQGDRYQVLLLSSTTITDEALESLGEKQQWLIRDLNAKAYPPTETRLPRGAAYPKPLNIGQRYFMDAATGTVQFVALREAQSS